MLSLQQRKWRNRGIGALLAVLLVGGFYIISLTDSRGTHDHGDAVLVDNGFWSYPRYWAHFPKLTIDGASVVTTYHVKGLPRTRYTLRIFLHDRIESRDAPDLERLIVGVRVIDASTGDTLCQHGSSMSEWTLAESVDYQYLWHESCRQIQLTGGRYSIKVTVKGGPPTSQTRALEVVLTGGGNELP